MVDNYRPMTEALEERIETLEERALAGRTQLVAQVLKVKRELAQCGGSSSRSVMPSDGSPAASSRDLR